MKLPFRPPKKKTLLASTARRTREADFTEEPNVKLSSAFVVVLVLHVVAVGGIYAFNAMKAHQATSFDEPETPAPAAPAVANAPSPDAAARPTPGAAGPTYYRVKSGDSIARIAEMYGIGAEELIALNHLRAQGGIHVGQDLEIPAGAMPEPEPAPVTPKITGPKDSGATYTVVRGDTPVSIARKLHVLYDDLVRLNKIEDPKKLKIGLKLKVPAKRAAV